MEWMIFSLFLRVGNIVEFVHNDEYIFIEWHLFSQGTWYSAT